MPSAKDGPVPALRAGATSPCPRGLVRLQLVINHGASFGLGASYEPLLAAATFVGMILLGNLGSPGSEPGQQSGRRACRRRRGRQPPRPPGAAPPAVLHGGVVDWRACVVLRADFQPGGYLAPGRPADRRRRVAMAAPDPRASSRSPTPPLPAETANQAGQQTGERNFVILALARTAISATGHASRRA